MGLLTKEDIERASKHPDAFRAENLSERPEGLPAIGDTFEFEYPATSNNPQATVWTYEVVGWERHKLNQGTEQISVRVKPISSRDRFITGYERCNMGHWHPTFSGEPAKSGAPDRWGF